MVKNPKEYMREYQRKRRARLKAKKQRIYKSSDNKVYHQAERSSLPTVSIEKPKIVVDPKAQEYGLTVAPIDTSVCLHCRSKHIQQIGDGIFKCRACGITYDLKVGFVQRVCAENEI